MKPCGAKGLLDLDDVLGAPWDSEPGNLPKNLKSKIWDSANAKNSESRNGDAETMQSQITSFFSLPARAPRKSAVSKNNSNSSNGPHLTHIRKSDLDARFGWTVAGETTEDSLRTSYGLSGPFCSEPAPSQEERKRKRSPSIDEESDASVSIVPISPLKKRKAPVARCSAVKCGTNPLCLNHMSQTKWTAANALKSFLAIRGVNAIEEIVKPGPVGLRNLGATCYLNTALQVWFSCRELREGILGLDSGLLNENVSLALSGSVARALGARAVVLRRRLFRAYGLRSVVLDFRYAVKLARSVALKARPPSLLRLGSTNRGSWNHSGP